MPKRWSKEIVYVDRTREVNNDVKERENVKPCETIGYKKKEKKNEEVGKEKWEKAATTKKT